MKKRFLFCLIILLSPCLTSLAQTVQVGNTTLTQREVAVELNIPWEMLWGNDDHLWVTERNGKVLRINPQNGNQTVVLDYESTASAFGESGMLGMAMHPDFDNTPLVYIVYTYLPAGTFLLKEKLVSFDWNGTELLNETVLLDDIDAGSIHNGSRILITPDLKILMTTGDTGSGNLSQDDAELSGKILRINLDGSIPDDNPTPNSYIYTLGHRNSQGLTIGLNNQIYSSEHGAQQHDEVNLIEAGRNYGWPNVEGMCDNTVEENFCAAFNVKEPLKSWSPCPAVNDLVYYNHPAIPEWKNSLLMAVLGGLDGGFERISQLKLNDNGTEILEENQYFNEFGRLRDICINPHNGAVYIATNGSNYPGAGPNRIIEYRNLNFLVNGINNPSSNTAKQFIKIAPNPASEKCQVHFSANFVGQSYQLISYTGQLIQTGSIETDNLTIDVGHLASGYYYVKASNTMGTITQSLLVK